MSCPPEDDAVSRLFEKSALILPYGPDIHIAVTVTQTLSLKAPTIIEGIR
jgi:hypothetical protein